MMDNKRLKIIQINSQHKRTASQTIINAIISEDFDIALIQEPYISTFHDKIPGLPNHLTQYSSQKPKKTTTAIIIKKSIQHCLLEEFSDDEIQTIKIIGKDNLILSSYYGKRSEVAISIKLAMLIEKKSKSHKIIIGADVNCHSVLVGYQKSDLRASEWDDFIMSHRLKVENDRFSHTFENSRNQRSTIDWTVSNPRALDCIDDWRVDYNASLLSDHHCIKFDIKVEEIPSCYKRNFNKVNWMTFNHQLASKMSSIEWQTMNVNVMAEETTKLIKETINECVPFKKQKRYKNEWWNENLQSLKTDLKRAKRHHSKEYLSLKEKFEKAIFKAKKLQFENFISNVQTADDAYLRYKIFCKRDQTRPMISSIRKSDGTLTEGTEQTYQTLLELNFPDDASINRNQTTMKHAINNKINRLTSSIHKPITNFEIERAVNSLKSKKSCGHDEIPSVVYKECIKTILPLMNRLFNESIQKSEFPSIWKKAKVIFLRKPDKPDALDAKSYRPISLLPVASKILEKIINWRLAWHSHQEKLIDHRQFGFQASTSSEHAALNLANQIYSSFKKRKETVAVFLDVKNAFPSAWHPGILLKMMRSKIPDYLLKWTKSYLENRIATVEIGETTVTKPLTRGTPQGAILSPWLWNIFINDLFKTVKSTGIQIQCFADDIVIYQQIKGKNNASILKSALKAIERWGETWGITFAANKTKAVHFTRLRKPSTLIPLAFNKTPIEYVESHRYVGVDFDCKLKWRQHIYRVTAKATSMLMKLNAVSSRKFGIPALSHKFIYERAILPIITYASSVWGQATETKYLLKQLQKVHRLASLGITGCFRTTASSTLLTIAKMQPIEYLIQEKIGVTYFSIERNKFLSEQRLNVRQTIEKHLSVSANESPIQFAQRMCLAETGNIRKLRPIDSFPHPADMKQLNTSILSKEDAIKRASSVPTIKTSIFTDASKTKDGEVGIAAVTYPPSSSSASHENKARLHKYETVHFGELAAIDMALKENFLHQERGNDLIIYSDSQAAIKSLANAYSRTPIIHEIHESLRQYDEKGISVEFTWVPGHQGVKGNERADELAKSAITCQELSTSERIWSKTKLKNELRALHWEMWQREWQSAKTGRFTFTLFPEVKKVPKNYSEEISFYDRKLLNRAKSGHFPTKSYLGKFKITNSDRCRYGCRKNENLDHILTKCPRFASLRLHDFRFKGMSFEPTTIELLTRDYLIKPTLKILKILLHDSEVGGTNS